MDIMYKKADISDLEETHAVVAAAVEHMNAEGIDQWDEVYPSCEVLRGDIERGEMYICLVGSALAGMYVLNKYTDEQYANGEWSYNGDDFVVIHRLVVSPVFQHKGIARQIIKHIEDELRASGVISVRLDVFTKNPYALRLYDSQGYAKVGTAHWRKGEFYLMEKLLTGENLA
ncbi:MAG: GNAT family N-acetyltransferase [Ruminococcus sp.]|nr:GNAT family N-acetyltransferase [Ruminococcus sp.]